jgi:hypothetical protein
MRESDFAKAMRLPDAKAITSCNCYRFRPRKQTTSPCEGAKAGRAVRSTAI